MLGALGQDIKRGSGTVMGYGSQGGEWFTGTCSWGPPRKRKADGGVGLRRPPEILAPSGSRVWGQKPPGVRGSFGNEMEVVGVNS